MGVSPCESSTVGRTGTMAQQQLFRMNPVQEPAEEPVTVRPNVWLMTSEEIPPLLFTVEEVAQFLRIGRHRVFDMIRTGDLRSVKVGSSRRVSARALADFVSALELEQIE